MQPLSILCHSFRDIDKYTTGFPCGDGQGHANIFRAVKHCLPGPVSMLSGSRGYSGGNIRYPLVPSLSNSYKVTCKIKRVESGPTIHWYTELAFFYTIDFSICSLPLSSLIVRVRDMVYFQRKIFN